MGENVKDAPPKNALTLMARNQPTTFMRTLSLSVITLLILLAGVDESIPDELPLAFRSAFEDAVRPGQTHAVVLRPWIPSRVMTDYPNHDAVDIVRGTWKRSGGFNDPGGRIQDYLNYREVGEVIRITYKKDRIELRVRSVRPHFVAEWRGFETGQVVTVFKFFLPFLARPASDVPRVLEYIDGYLKLLPSADAAVVFAEGLARPGASPATPLQAPKTLELGQTPEQVKAIFGPPDKIADLGSRLLYFYPDMTVVFVDGRLTDVQHRWSLTGRGGVENARDGQLVRRSCSALGGTGFGEHKTSSGFYHSRELAARILSVRTTPTPRGDEVEVGR